MKEPLEGRVDRASDVPLGTQLVEQIRSAVVDGRLEEGDRLPSVRELAETAGVNVNTVRAAYARLEAEGLVRSEHGRGTFVAGARGSRAGTRGSREGVRGSRAGARGSRPGALGSPVGALGDAPALSRGELREQIAALEATLARLPPPPLGAEDATRRPGAALLSTEELQGVRDRLLERLRRLDSERTALLESLEELGLEPEAAEAGAREPESAASRRATPSLAGARIRWVGA